MNFISSSCRSVLSLHCAAEYDQMTTRFIIDLAVSDTELIMLEYSGEPSHSSIIVINNKYSFPATSNFSFQDAFGHPLPSELSLIKNCPDNLSHEEVHTISSVNADSNDINWSLYFVNSSPPFYCMSNVTAADPRGDRPFILDTNVQIIWILMYSIMLTLAVLGNLLVMWTVLGKSVMNIEDLIPRSNDTWGMDF